jgi:hypothetical protein
MSAPNLPGSFLEVSGSLDRVNGACILALWCGLASDVLAVVGTRRRFRPLVQIMCVRCGCQHHELGRVATRTFPRDGARGTHRPVDQEGHSAGASSRREVAAPRGQNNLGAACAGAGWECGGLLRMLFWTRPSHGPWWVRGKPLVSRESRGPWGFQPFGMGLGGRGRPPQFFPGLEALHKVEAPVQRGCSAGFVPRGRSGGLPFGIGRTPRKEPSTPSCQARGLLWVSRVSAHVCASTWICQC